MKKIDTTKRIISILASASLILSLAACSPSGSSAENPGGQKETVGQAETPPQGGTQTPAPSEGSASGQQEGKKVVKAQPSKEDDSNKDVDLTEKLKGEAGVLDAKVYLKDDYVIGTMIIDKGVTEADAKNLAQKYADQLKAKYSDKKVNVQAVQDGNNIANITIE